jgi:hypothetical protein
MRRMCYFASNFWSFAMLSNHCRSETIFSSDGLLTGIIVHRNSMRLLAVLLTSGLGTLFPPSLLAAFEACFGMLANELAVR